MSRKFAISQPVTHKGDSCIVSAFGKRYDEFWVRFPDGCEDQVRQDDLTDATLPERKRPVIGDRVTVRDDWTGVVIAVVESRSEFCVMAATGHCFGSRNWVHFLDITGVTPGSSITVKLIERLDALSSQLSELRNDILRG